MERKGEERDGIQGAAAERLVEEGGRILAEGAVEARQKNRAAPVRDRRKVRHHELVVAVTRRLPEDEQKHSE